MSARLLGRHLPPDTQLRFARLEGQPGGNLEQPVKRADEDFRQGAIDGAYSASFLKRVKEIIETRDWRAAF